VFVTADQFSAVQSISQLSEALWGKAQKVKLGINTLAYFCITNVHEKKSAFAFVACTIKIF